MLSLSIKLKSFKLKVYLPAYFKEWLHHALLKRTAILWNRIKSSRNWFVFWKRSTIPLKRFHILQIKLCLSNYFDAWRHRYTELNLLLSKIRIKHRILCKTIFITWRSKSIYSKHIKWKCTRNWISKLRNVQSHHLYAVSIFSTKTLQNFFNSLKKRIEVFFT